MITKIKQESEPPHYLQGSIWHKGYEDNNRIFAKTEGPGYAAPLKGIGQTDMELNNWTVRPVTWYK